MQFPTLLLLLAPAANGHYAFSSLVSNGVMSYYSKGTLTDVLSTSIRCNFDGATKSASTKTVAAGSTVGFTAVTSISNSGTLKFYMAKVPAGQMAATWDGSGNVWFKTFGQGPGGLGTSALPWRSQDRPFLLHFEHIALHSASSAGGAQFYISCAHIKVSGVGSGNLGPLVAFPGAYKATDPGLMINSYYRIPTCYTLPGPGLWTD
ncbi:fungal cellulose binding domain-containing protein [Calycina marina]|uniref:lytic cellulose monooxygenase (C4-dehydrogenating) n=1 Tax=Calycina marina TaxID=1763456 RepID=A0A9P7Z1N3_9HELO|nr:fungal cellulose binding domain-containing protein [Calycina marina]